MQTNFNKGYDLSKVPAVKERIAEYYFSYDIKNVYTKEGVEISDPRIYFERNLNKSNLPYTMFVVFNEWVDKFDEYKQLFTGNTLTDSLPYDKIEIVYDVKGISALPLADRNSKDYKEAETKISCDFKTYYDENCKVEVHSKESNDCSGIGVIEMLKDGEVVARFFFYINYTSRKKIFYSITRKANDLNLYFYCQDKPVNIEVNLGYEKNKLCCLKETSPDEYITLPLKFNKKEIYQVVKLKSAFNNKQACDDDNIFVLRFTSDDMARFYLLDCIENNTLKINKPKHVDVYPRYSCPYCHNSIDTKISSTKEYKKCGGHSCNINSTQGEKIYNAGKLAKKMLYCDEEFPIENSKRKGKELHFMRALPANFFDYNNYKILCTGSTRSGKTTYLSRFFDIKCDYSDNGKNSSENATIDMSIAKNCLSRLGISVESVKIPRLVKSNDKVSVDINDWCKQDNFYKSRGTSLLNKSFPSGTTVGDYTMFPFIAQVNNKPKSYIYMYDQAGEDSQKTPVYLKKVVGSKEANNIVGIFLFINGIQEQDPDHQKPRDVVDEINLLVQNGEINPNCPVAVILTKADIHDDKFDPNSYVLRTDYYKQYESYDGSALERNIDFSSEEVKTFLINEGIYPSLSKAFTNVKYFAISSFNFGDSIADNSNMAGMENSEVGYLLFECSPKRIDLPFVWMLRQFDVIK